MYFLYPTAMGLAAIVLALQVNELFPGERRPPPLWMDAQKIRTFIKTFPNSKEKTRTAEHFIPAQIHSKVSRDPKGWRDFKWEMTKEETGKLGAKPFRDKEGTRRFGLPEVELLPGKRFWVDLGFYSHINLAHILINMEMDGTCATKEYEQFLLELRNRYGTEKESKNLDYPNAWFLSHVWVMGTTKIALNHSCNRPGALSNKSFLLSLRYERRRTMEIWNP